MKEQRDVYVCDRCSNSFQSPEDVRIFVGNVLTGDGGGLIGNNFRKKNKVTSDENKRVGEIFGEMNVLQNMLCLSCTMKALYIDMSLETGHPAYSTLQIKKRRRD